jgi:hypothetical protein
MSTTPHTPGKSTASSLINEIFSPENRDKTRLTMVEKCPWWVSLIVFLIFIVALVASITTLAFVQPPVMVTVDRTFPYDTHGFFVNSLF